MSSIAQTSGTGMSAQNYQGLQEASLSSTTSQMEVYSELSTGLTIQTREGDVVTLSSSSLSQYSSYSYNSQGMVETDSGTAMVTTNYSEITLTTGETFSFSVQGDLNEEELADIEAIIKGIDEVIGEVVEGDMKGAIGQAVLMAMEDYDSISMFTADISYATGYSVMEKSTGAALGTTDAASLPDTEQDSESGSSDTRKTSAVEKAQSILEKMTEKLAEREEKLLEKARQPLASLFQHYLDKAEEDEEETSTADVLEKMGQTLDQMIADMVMEAFSTSLDKYL